MEAYIINGCEVQYDTFDLEAMALFDSETQKVGSEAKKVVADGMTADNYIGIVRKQCENIMSFFDTLLGEGASSEIFGDRINVKTVTLSYRKFCDDVMEMRASLAGDFKPPKEKRANVVRISEA